MSIEWKRDRVTMTFVADIDDKEVAQVAGKLHRIYELLLATINLHAHSGFHLASSEYTNCEKPTVGR